MDSFLNELVSQQFMSTVMEYTQQNNALQVNIFVEGDEDSILYINLIERYAKPSAKTNSFICNGKKKVYQVYDYIEKNIDRDIQEARLYFVDKDLSDLLTDDPTPSLEYLYITENYSIENDIATEDMARRCIRDLYNITGPINKDQLLGIYLEFRKKIDTIIGRIMAWIIFQRRGGFKPTLRGIDLSKIILIDSSLNLTDELTALEVFAAKFPDAIKYSNTDIENQLSNLKLLPKKRWMRGKYDIWAFSIFFKKAIDYVKSNGGTLKEKIPLGGKSFIYHILPRYTPSENLESFIKSHMV